MGEPEVLEEENRALCSLSLLNWLKVRKVNLEITELTIVHDGLIEDLETLTESNKLLHLEDKELGSAKEEISKLTSEIQRLGEERGRARVEILRFEVEL